MNTECTLEQLEFHGLGRRDVIGKFNGGKISSDGGGVLLREIEQHTHMLRRLSPCFVDHRHPERIEHSLEALIKQRVMGLAQGYEDLNDHDELCRDSLLVDLFLESHETPPEKIVLDVDATDDPLHGQQEGCFFHGYYGHYCYLPLYIFL